MYDRYKTLKADTDCLLEWISQNNWREKFLIKKGAKMDNDNWLCFVNCKMDPATEEWEMMKKDIWTLPDS